jgi:hypothetical protein
VPSDVGRSAFVEPQYTWFNGSSKRQNRGKGMDDADVHGKWRPVAKSNLSMNECKEVKDCRQVQKRTNVGQEEANE